VTDLADIHPTSSVPALLALDDKALEETLLACRDLYHEGHALLNGQGRRVFDRDATVREILMLRARFQAMTPEARARLTVNHRGPT
jgi:hypothetical protein